MSYLWGTCDSNLFGGATFYRDSCQTTYQLYVDVWPVYSATNAANPDNPATDYFVMQLSGNLKPGACYGWYDGRSHDDRISAYWARTYQFTANVAQHNGAYWDFQNLAVASGYNPPTQVADVSVDTGTTWSIEGSGTAGADSSVGFTAGAEFSHSVTATYAALDTTANIQDSTGANPGQAQWTYDSWDFVNSSIASGSNICQDGLWQDVAAPPIITTGTFSPQMTYVWEVSKTMRETYTGASPCTASCTGGGCTVPSTTAAACLPVEVDLGVLLGWAYFPIGFDEDHPQCNTSDSNYALDNNPDGQSTNGSYDWSPLSSSNPNPSGLASLYFDVSCSGQVAYGTVPLGAADASSQNNSIGNPGPLHTMSLTLNIPFAATPAP